jgi:hypothetical protein
MGDDNGSSEDDRNVIGFPDPRRMAFDAELERCRSGWRAVFEAWSKIAAEECPAIVSPTLSFQKLEVKSPEEGIRIGPVADFWPRHEVERRRSELEERRNIPKRWKFRKGVLRTARLLYQHRGDVELRSAVLLGAALRDIQKDYVANRRDFPVHIRLVSTMLELATVRLTEGFASPYHSSSRRVLPLQTTALTVLRPNVVVLDPAKRPSGLDPEGLLRIVAMLLEVVHEEWTLVLVRSDDAPSFEALDAGTSLTEVIEE